MACECDKGEGGCVCIFTAGLNVSITGGGTAADPVTINVDAVTLTGLDGVNTDVTVSGNGDVTNPYLVKIDLKSALYADKADLWVGEEVELGLRPPGPRALAVVTAPMRHIVGFANVHVGDERLVRLYLGDVMVADDLGGILGPGI
jgi:hypothetical protein